MEEKEIFFYADEDLDFLIEKDCLDYVRKAWHRGLALYRESEDQDSTLVVFINGLVMKNFEQEVGQVFCAAYFGMVETGEVLYRVVFDRNKYRPEEVITYVNEIVQHEQKSIIFN